jgi:RimJ/RimL family protein N-acetyltransferase
MHPANDIRMASTIETPRLILRGWTDEDAQGYADMVGDERVMEFFVQRTPREEALTQARTMAERFEKNAYGRYVLEIKGRPGFSGMMALDDIRYPVPFQPTREIGWLLHTDAWGKGYASEAAQALLRYAFDDLAWPEVVAMTATINVRSQRVMQRLGMTREPAEDFDHPRVPQGHPLERHVLYRANAGAW